MPRSKNITEYFEIAVTDLRPGSELPFDVHLYFSQNQHLILLRRSGDTLAEDFGERYEARGVRSLWVHEDDRQLFEQYTGTQSAEEPIPADTAEFGDLFSANHETAAPEAAEEASEKTESTEEAPARAPTPEGAAISELMASTAVPEEIKQEIIAGTAQDLIAAAVTAEDETEQKQVTEKAKQMIRDVLSGGHEGMAEELWEMTQSDPELEHPVNVATFAVMFAMAFGKIDHKLIADLAMAALLHDIGLAQLPMGLATKPMKSLGKEDLKRYGEHVKHSVSAVGRFGKSLPPRVLEIIQQHHEKFDGSGYPKGLHGFNINDAAQLMSMADLLDTVSSGAWDGTRRNLRDSFKVIEDLEKKKSFPQFFNPELFGKVAGWARTEAAVAGLETAVDVVQDKTQELFEPT